MNYDKFNVCVFKVNKRVTHFDSLYCFLVFHRVLINSLRSPDGLEKTRRVGVNELVV